MMGLRIDQSDVGWLSDINEQEAGARMKEIRYVPLDFVLDLITVEILLPASGPLWAED